MTNMSRLYTVQQERDFIQYALLCTVIGSYSFTIQDGNEFDLAVSNALERVG